MTKAAVVQSKISFAGFEPPREMDGRAFTIEESCGPVMMKIGGAGVPLEVLLVEDSPGDVRLTREAFRNSETAINLKVASDGVEAMAVLRREGPHVDALRPDFILLDLNLPRMDGREVLACIKADTGLKTIPTIVLSASAAEEDIERSYQLQANCYLTKPVQLDEFDSLVKSITDFWLTKVKLPRPSLTEPEPRDLRQKSRVA